MKKFFALIIQLRSYLLQRITNKAEIRNIERKKYLWDKVILSEEEDREIRDYWKDISGYDISTKWHRLYQSYMGVYDKRYFPEILYSTKLERLLSPEKFNSVLADKYLITSIYNGGVSRLPLLSLMLPECLPM